MKKAFKPKMAKEDYTAAMLPHNRREVFFDVLKLNWKSLIGCGLVMLIFFLPCIITAMAEDLVAMQLTEAYDAASPEQQASISSQLLTVKNTRAVLDIISYAVLSVGIAGMVRVIRQYAWGESVFFASDFGKGIKQNAKQMLAVGLLYGIVNLLTVYAYNMSAVTADIGIAIAAILSADILILAAVPTLWYTAVSIPVYDKKLHKHLLTSLAVTARAPFKTFGAVCGSYIPFLGGLIPTFYSHIFGRIVGIILLPFVLLGWTLFAYNRFDESINKQKFPELVGRGTFPLDAEDTEKDIAAPAEKSQKILESNGENHD